MSNRKTLINAAVAACFVVADSKGKATDAARALFAGVPTAKRDEVRGEWYAAIRERAPEVDGKPCPARDLPADVKRAYGAAREAYRALFGSGAKGGKKKGKKSKAVVVPMDLKGITRMAKAADRAIGKLEDAPFDVVKVRAAWLALAAAYAPMK